jgi:hypothetical protein
VLRVSLFIAIAWIAYAVAKRSLDVSKDRRESLRTAYGVTAMLIGLFCLSGMFWTPDDDPRLARLLSDRSWAERIQLATRQFMIFYGLVAVGITIAAFRSHKQLARSSSDVPKDGKLPEP